MLGDAVVVVFVVLDELLELPPAGEGFTIVVLFSVAGAGEAPVVGVTSVRCSQPPRSAALARMQIIFFIFRMGCPCGQTSIGTSGSFGLA